MARSVIWEGNSVPFGTEDARPASGHRAVYDDVSKAVIFERAIEPDALGVIRWMRVDYVPHQYVMDFAKLLDEKDVVYQCFWCLEGILVKLPGTCPKCHKEVGRRLDQMTDKELQEVYFKKFGGGPQGPTYSLAVKEGEKKPNE